MVTIPHPEVWAARTAGTGGVLGTLAQNPLGYYQAHKNAIQKSKSYCHIARERGPGKKSWNLDSWSKVTPNITEELKFSQQCSCFSLGALKNNRMP